MTGHRRVRRVPLAVAVTGLVGACVAAGCGAAGIGLGSLGLAIAAFGVYAAVAMSAGSACYASHPDEDAGGEMHACLTYRGEDGDGEPDIGPCLEPPWDAEVCLTPVDVPDDAAVRDDADVGPCLEPPVDGSDDATAPDDGGEDGLPICDPWWCDVCLEAPIDHCILVCPPPDAGSAVVEPRSAAQQHLASAGVLSPEQLARLRRLQGRNG